MSENLTREKHKQGTFALNEKGEVVLREAITTETYNKTFHSWTKNKKTYIETPVTKLGWTKKLEDAIVLKKIVPSRTDYKGFDVLLFLKKITYEVREDKPYTFLQKVENKQSRKIALRNFNTGITSFVPSNSNDQVKVTENENKPTTKEKVLEMYEQGIISEVFDSEETVNGEKIYKKQVYVK